MPNRNRVGLISLVAFLVLIGAIWLLWPSATIAPAPATQSVSPIAAAASPTVASQALPADATPEPETSASEPSEDAGESTPRLFVVDPAQSEARFIVDEVLFGLPNTVIGVTSDVTGSISVDPVAPHLTTLTPIRVDARTLVTDNRFRNRSISRQILQSNQDAFQFITFTVTAIEGFPAQLAVNEAVTLQVTGDLQIRHVVQSVTFEVTAHAISETEITGLAGATVQRADFDLNIPTVEGVADVAEDVRLEFEFVALAVE